MGLIGILAHADLFETHALNLCFEVAVLGAHSAQVKVVVPEVAGRSLRPDQGLFERSNSSNRPDSDQARGFTVGRALDLHGQAEHLGEQHAHQHDQIAVASEDIHNISSQFSVLSEPVMAEILSRDLSLDCHPERSEGSAVRSQLAARSSQRYSIEILRSSLKSESILPVPSTTLQSGSSAIETGSPVSSRMRLSRFLISAPPPVSTIPRSLMSADSSGGVRSSATRIAFIMVETHSLNDSRISLSSTVTVLGTPSIRLRPLISMVSGLSSGYAEPISILICSPVRSPISRLYFRLR